MQTGLSNIFTSSAIGTEVLHCMSRDRTSTKVDRPFMLPVNSLARVQKGLQNIFDVMQKPN